MSVSFEAYGTELIYNHRKISVGGKDYDTVLMFTVLITYHFLSISQSHKGLQSDPNAIRFHLNKFTEG